MEIGCRVGMELEAHLAHSGGLPRTDKANRARRPFCVVLLLVGGGLLCIHVVL